MRASSKRLWKTLKENVEILLPLKEKHEWRPVLSTRETRTKTTWPIPMTDFRPRIGRVRGRRGVKEKGNVPTPKDLPATGPLEVEARVPSRSSGVRDAQEKRQNHNAPAKRTMIAVGNLQRVAKPVDVWKTHAQEVKSLETEMNLEMKRLKERSFWIRDAKTICKGRGPVAENWSLDKRRKYLKAYGTAWWEHRWEKVHAPAKAKFDKQIKIVNELRLRRKAIYSKVNSARRRLRSLTKALGKAPLLSVWSRIQSQSSKPPPGKKQPVRRG